MTDKKPKKLKKRGAWFTKDRMLGTVLDEGRFNVRDDERAKQAFFDAIGLTDERPYAALDAAETISIIRESAGIKLDDIGLALGLDGRTTERPRQLIRDAAWLSKPNIPKNATRLGKAMAPLLQEKIEEGLLHKTDFTQVAGAKQKAAQKAALSLKTLLLEKLGLSPDALSHYEQQLPKQMISYFYDILLHNKGVTSSDIAHAINPDKTRDYIVHRCIGSTNIDEDFISQFAAAIKPHIQQGIKEGWVDANGQERPFEAILADKLPTLAAKVGKVSGIEALKRYISESRVPATVISCTLGHTYNWVAQHYSSDREQFYAKDIVDIADVLVPYVQGEKKWDGVFKVTPPEELEAHARMKEFLVAAIERKASIPLYQLREVAKHHDTIGPLVRELCDTFNISRDTIRVDGKSIAQSTFALLKQNCFSGVDKDGNIRDNYKKIFEAMGESFGAAYQTRTPPPPRRDDGWAISVKDDPRGVHGEKKVSKNEEPRRG